jgi:hypothetical protein
MKWLAWPLAMVLAISGTSSGLETQESSEKPPVQTREQRKSDQVKAEVARRGVGEKSRVRVKLRNKLEFKGHITQIEQDRFQLQIDPDWLDADTSKDRLVEIPYAEVEVIRGPRSRAANIGIGVGLTVALLAVVAAVLVLKYDKYRRSQ